MLAILTFIGFTGLVAIIAWLATRGTNEKSADGFYLGGRSLGAITIAGSLLLTNLSAEQIVGLNGQAFTEGILVMAWETLAAVAMILTALILLPKYLRQGITTIPEFIENRFDRHTKAIMSILFLISYGIVLLPTILYSGSLAVSSMFDLPTMLDMSQNQVIWLCVWGIGIVGSIYAIFGGLKAVAVSDLINAIGLLIGGFLIPYFGLKFIGDGSMSDGMNVLITEHPEKFDLKGQVDSSIPFGTIFTGMILAQMYYWGTNQSILQRVFAAKSLAEGQKGVILAGFVKFLIPLIVVLPGVIAWHVFDGDLPNADLAYPELVRKVLPPEFLGFFAAVLFGAILSSFNSLLNSSATLFGFDLYKQYFKEDATEEQTVKAGKLFGLGLAVIALCIAPFIANAGSLFGYIQEALGSLSVPILAVVVVGMYTKKVPSIGAKIVLIAGVIMYLTSQFVLSPMFIEDALAAAAASGITDPKQLSIIKAEAYPHFLHIMAILFIVNVSIMLFFAKFKPRTEPIREFVTDEIDVTPWKYGLIVGVIITVIVISTYFIF